MSEQEKQESQKTVVAFVAGLLIGGLLVWVFSGSPEETPTDEPVVDDTTEGTDLGPVSTEDSDNEPSVDDSDTEDEPTEPAIAELPTGDGAIEVNNQPAGSSVVLAAATFPNDEGWVGVRDFRDGQLVGLLGVARYSKEQGLVPEEITLQRSTASGETYAVVFYTESGDRIFSLADDVQVDGIMETFQAE